MLYLKQLFLAVLFVIIITMIGCAIPSVQHWAEAGIGQRIEVIRELETLQTSYASKIGWKETTYPLENGNRIFVHPIRKDCSVHFEVNPQGIIVDYKAIGNRCY
jgi:hypothetical protein